MLDGPEGERAKVIPLKLRVALGLTASLQIGCFESKTPLGPSNEGIVDKALLGTWKCLSPEESPKEASLLVTAFDDRQYFAEWHEGEDVTRYRAYSAQVGRARLLNVQPLGVREGNAAWIFLKPTVSPDGHLILDIIPEESIKELRGKQALAEIRRRSSDPTLFVRFASCSSEEQ